MFIHQIAIQEFAAVIEVFSVLILKSFEWCKHPTAWALPPLSFSSVLFSSATCIHGAVPQACRTSSPCKTETLCPIRCTANDISPCPHLSGSWPPSFCLSLPWVWLLSMPRINGSILCLSFCDWLMSLSITSSVSIHVVAHDRVSFFGWVTFHCMYSPIFFVHSSNNRHLDCFYFLAIYWN